MASKTIVPVQSAVEVKQESEVKTGDNTNIEIVNVTIEKDKESAVILFLATSKVIEQAFKLQDDYENPSQFQRDALHDASIMFLKYRCQQAIQQWDNLVTKFSKTTKYKNMGRADVEERLRIHPKTVAYYKRMQQAVSIKSQLK